MNPIQKIKLPTSNVQPAPFRLSGKIVNPKRDWKILIILLATFIVASVGFDAYIYLQIVSGDMYVSVGRQDLVIENLKTSALQAIASTFENKKAKITTLKLENLVDPSI